MFPSGHWRGWYVQFGAQHESNAQIEFIDGAMQGHGCDQVGAFRISGKYDPKSLTADWLKTYSGAHNVQYIGTLIGDVLQGTWTITCGAHGTFELTAPALLEVK